MQVETASPNYVSPIPAETHTTHRLEGTSGNSN